MLEGPLVEAQQIDLVLAHLPRGTPFSIPNQCAAPNDNA